MSVFDILVVRLFKEKTVNHRPDALQYQPPTTIAYNGSTLHTTKYETKVPHLHKLQILILSFLASFLTVANPFLADLSNSLQSQYLYIGQLLLRGQLPYSDIFSTGGILYFLLIAISYAWGSSFWLIAWQTLFFYGAGIYFYKLVAYFTSNQKVASVFTVFYFLGSFGLGFGGLYPIQFAMPFLLAGLWFLTKYFAQLTKDEAFIFFGCACALAMLLEPRSLVFGLVSLVVVMSYNYQKRHLARGFYQFLAAVFGFLLVCYTAGYFILSLQLLKPYLNQAFLYSLTTPGSGVHPLLLGFLLQLVVAGGLGLFTGLGYFLEHRKEEDDSWVKWLMVIVAFGYLFLALFAREYLTYPLLAMLPFALILTAIPVNQRFNKYTQRTTHHRSKNHSASWLIRFIYLQRHFYLPLVTILLLVAWPLIGYVRDLPVHKERHAISQYLLKNGSITDQLYVWDTSARIYQETQMKSASHFPTPLVNLSTKANKQLLVDELLQNRARYIVVNQKLPLPAKIGKVLKTNYRKVRKDSSKHFHLYQKK